MVRRILAAAWVALVLFAVPALATVKNHRVKIRIPDAPYTLMTPGQPWQGEIALTAPGGADIESFTFEGEGWVVEPLRPGAMRAALAAGERILLPLRVQRANPERPLTMRYTVNGETIEQPVNLRGLTRERVRVLPLRRATPAELATVPILPDVATAKAAGLPHDRRSRDAEGLLRGAIGATRLSDGGDQLAPHAEGTPQSTQARSIRIRCSIIGQGPVAGFGGDGVYYAVYDEDSGIDELLAEGTTDQNGAFDVTINWDPCFLCDSNPDIYVYFETENDHVVTQSPKLEWEYSWETGVTADYTGTNLNLSGFMPGDQESNGVLYVHTAINRMWRWFDGMGWEVPSVDVQAWDDDATPVSYYSPLGEIHMSPTRMFNTSSISHEYHHHWMEEFSNSPAPDYCNGSCDQPGNCGHCYWCQEPGNVVWTEGFPEAGEHLAFDMFQSTYPGFTTDLRGIEQVDSCGVAVDDGHKTEGLFAAAVYDLVDVINEDDLVIPGTSIDMLAFNQRLPYQIYDEVMPGTPTAFFNEVSSRNPGQKKAIWATAMNGGVNLDTSNPAAVTGLTSASHVPNVSSTDNTVALNWTEAVDDWSGAWLHSVNFSASPALPDTFSEVTNVTAMQGPPLAVGSWYANIRVRDRHGRWGTTFASSGPYVIRAPDPGDHTLVAAASWAEPVVPRNASDAFFDFVPAPTVLAGNAATTRWNAAVINAGETLAAGAKLELEVDGDSLGFLSIPSINPGSYNYALNRGPVTVRGGRHTFGCFMDSEEQVAEPDETNNAWARQWGWSGLPMLPSSLIARAAAPARFAGHTDIGAGELVHVNSDGFRFASSGWWNAVWAYATDPGDDTDVRLHFPSSVPDTAFSKVIASSVRLGGYLDAVLVNRNTLGVLNWDAGVVNWSGGASGFRAKHVTSNAFLFGDSVDVNFPADEFITLHDMLVGAGNLGDVVVTLRTAPGAVAHVSWFDRTFTYGGLGSAGETATTDENGMARFIVNVGSVGYYGVVCQRDPKDGTGPLPFTLQVERAPADLAVFDVAGWHSPVVPRPATDGTFASVPLPDTLHGNTLPTYFNMAAKNIGTIAAPATSSWMMVDGALAATYGYPLWNAGAQMLFNSTYAVYIRGGRHTLSHILDGPDLVEELVNENNQYGEQYVWSPLPLVAEAPVTRIAPPDRTAGWSEVSNGDPLYFNSDGFRTAAAPPSAGAHQWSAVAVMPAATSDVDLRIHERSPGTKNGFRNPLATSVWTAGASDYVLANFNLTPYRQFDVGAVRWNGTDNYTVQATTSQRRTISPVGEIGTFSQAANDILDLHEVWLTPGTWYLNLEPLSGDANLGLSLHGSTAIQGKSNALASAWYEPAGVYEQVAVEVLGASYFCVAVWKTGSADLAQPVTYRLVASSGVVAAGGDTPREVAFGLPSPNPASGTTRVTFALPAPGPVEIDVFDVSGGRVRTLLRGEQPAGRHSVQWDGRTNGGRRAPAGLYYLRFSGGGVVETRKLVVVAG